ncbi:MAG: tetratricopeptide repeat protein [Candidatus Promineifilaceae bacterium]
MTRRKSLILALATLALLAGSWLAAGRPGRTAEAVLLDPATLEQAHFARLPAAAEGIAFFERRLAADPQDAVSMTLLGQLYLSQARQSGAVAGYARAQTALEGALALLPGYAPAETALAAVLFSQHRFQEALSLAQALYDADPRRLDALAIAADSHFALGRYAEAEAGYAELLERAPGPALYARLAHQAELHGRPAEALELLERAAGAALAQGLPQHEVAWYFLRLGEVNFNRGRLAAARGYYAAAVKLDGDYPPALAALAKAYAAEGETGEAIGLYQQSLAHVPAPEVLAALGDLYASLGRPAEAQAQYDTVLFIGRLSVLNEQLYNRQLATFLADHNLEPGQALALATAELEARQDIYGYDAAAWAAYKAGDLAQAGARMAQALSLGTQDARLFYHAGMIALAQGRPDEARQWLGRALALNPHFDPLQAEQARQSLQEIGTKR